MSGFPVARCCGCGRLFFPRRLICRHCGSDRFDEERLHEAVVEEVTTVTHVAGGGRDEPRVLATVRAAPGPRLVVGLAAALPEGTRVRLSERDGAPVAREVDDDR